MKSLRVFPRLRPEAALCAVSLAWGTTFLIIHTAMHVCGPMFFVGMRFGVGSIASLILFRAKMRALTRRELKAGLIIGMSIFLGYGLQTTGLKTIPSSQSAFITAFYVPLVPLLQWLVLRRRPGLLSLAGTAMAFLGLLLVAGANAHGLTIGFGEAVTIAGTVAVAAEILLLGYFVDGIDNRRAAVVQLATASAAAFAAMTATGEALPAFSWMWVAPVAVLGIADAGIQLAINWAQKSISPTRATLIYAGEPVWAGIFGRIAGDRLPGTALLGAGLIVAAIVVSGRKPQSDPAASDENTRV